MTGSDLYRRTVDFAYARADDNRLMRKIWEPTPWMLDVYTGSSDSRRFRLIREWCHETFGDQSSPIHDQAGQWHQGGATIYGWTWLGFATREQMDLFACAWPVPPLDQLTDAEIRVGENLGALVRAVS